MDQRNTAVIMYLDSGKASEKKCPMISLRTALTEKCRLKDDMVSELLKIPNEY